MCNQFLRVVDEVAASFRTPAAFDDVDSPFAIRVNCNGGVVMRVRILKSFYNGGNLARDVGSYRRTMVVSFTVAKNLKTVKRELEFEELKELVLELEKPRSPPPLGTPGAPSGAHEECPQPQEGNDAQ